MVDEVGPDRDFIVEEGFVEEGFRLVADTFVDAAGFETTFSVASAAELELVVVFFVDAFLGDAFFRGFFDLPVALLFPNLLAGFLRLLFAPPLLLDLASDPVSFDESVVVSIESSFFELMARPLYSSLENEGIYLRYFCLRQIREPRHSFKNYFLCSPR